MRAEELLALSWERLFRVDEDTVEDCGFRGGLLFPIRPVTCLCWASEGDMMGGDELVL